MVKDPPQRGANIKESSSFQEKNLFTDYRNAFVYFEIIGKYIFCVLQYALHIEHVIEIKWEIIVDYYFLSKLERCKRPWAKVESFR